MTPEEQRAIEHAESLERRRRFAIALNRKLQPSGAYFAQLVENTKALRKW